MTRGLITRAARTTLPITAACLTLALGGCTSNSPGVSSASSAPARPASGWAGQEAVKEAIALLTDGQPAEARRRLIKVLKSEPGNMIARKLVDQIDKDPKQLLGARNFSYVVKKGDTFSQLAQTYLGDPMLFYALARYNGSAAAGAPPAGSRILIPGVAPAVRKPAVPEPRASKPSPAKPVKAEPAPAPIKPVAPPADKARAAKLRGQGLAAMNNGSIDRAVMLLRQALGADPENAVIKSDLNRALRIQGRVRR